MSIGQGRPDRDSFLVEVGTKFNLLEFIFIFDVVFGFYRSVQKSRQKTEIKSYCHLIFFLNLIWMTTILGQFSPVSSSRIQLFEYSLFENI